MLGGDCTLVVGAVGGRARRPRASRSGSSTSTPTPTSTRRRPRPPGYLSGMALALALGRGPAEVVARGAATPPAVAARARRAGRLPRARPRRARGARRPGPGPARRGRAPARACGWRRRSPSTPSGNDDGPVVVHLDVDVIDPAEMPAKDVDHAGRGLTLAEVSDLVTALAGLAARGGARGRRVPTPSAIPTGVRARKLVDLIVRAVARRLPALTGAPRSARWPCAERQVAATTRQHGQRRQHDGGREQPDRRDAGCCGGR